MKKEKTTILFEADLKLKERAAEYARKNGTNLSTLIRRSLENEMSGTYSRTIEKALEDFVSKIPKHTPRTAIGTKKR
jgi:hypothetical protein